jgi:hypothetical protein
MIIADYEASAFIQGYTLLMIEIYGPLSAKPTQTLLEVMAAARTKYLAKRSLLDEAIRALEKKGTPVSDAVVSAVQSLEVKQWIYLKDTRSHSVFIDPSGEAAYGVQGLTERMRDIIGGTGAIVETGVVRYLGRYVTDGIVSGVVWIGPNYKKAFSNTLTELRKTRKFHATSMQ